MTVPIRGAERGGEPRRREHRLAVRIVSIYAALAALWIAASDWLLRWLVADPTTLTAFATLKGLVFVAATGALLYLLVERGLRPIADSERRYREMVEDGPSIFLKVDATGTVLSVNPLGARQLGYSPAELPGRSILGLYAEADRRTMMKQIDALARGDVEVARWEAQAVRKDGGFVWLRHSARAVDAAGSRRAVLLVGEDITDRKGSEFALGSANEHLRAVIRSSPAAIVAADHASRILTWSLAAERMFGWTEEEVLARPDPLLPRTGLAEHEALRARVLAGESILGFELPLVNRDGAPLEVSGSWAPLRDETGQVVATLGVYLDLTESKRTAERLVRTTSELQAIFGAFPDLYFRIDASDRIVDHHAGRTSDLYVPPEVFLGRTMREVLPGEIWPSLEEAGRLARVEGSAIAEYPLSLPTGRKWFEARFVHLSGGEMLCIVRDITERHAAEESIRRYAQRLELMQEIDRAILVAQSPEDLASSMVPRIRRLVPCERASIELFDPARDEVRVVAAAAEDDLGSKGGEALPTRRLALPADESARRVDDVGARGATHPPGLESAASEIQSLLTVPLFADGKPLGELALASARPRAFDEEHRQIAAEVAGQIAVAIHQSRLREELDRHAAELERRVEERTREIAGANAELESFTFSVTHDLRAPLRAMDGFARALVEDHAGQLGPQGREYAQRVAGAALRMDALIQDLLEYSRVRRAELRLKTVPLDPVVAEVIDQRVAVLRGVAAEVSIDSPLADVIAHRATLIQVVGNLMDNALKFVRQGEPPRIHVRAERVGDRVRLWVEDQGIGIAPDDRERIFEVFQRLHGVESYAGSGIGLAIVRKAMERMGGRAGVESELGRGSRFWIELEAAGGATQGRRPPALDGESS